MKGLGATLNHRGAAVFVLARKVSGDKLLERLEEFRGSGRVIQTSLSRDDEKSLQEFIESRPDVRDAAKATARETGNAD